ncbi:MAG: hypothetical protein NTW00_10010, partial [Hyphomicrobiales bacterium]|nr:hypothetical protein [Hyphomicrobiales bacterium]
RYPAQPAARTAALELATAYRAKPSGRLISISPRHSPDAYEQTRHEQRLNMVVSLAHSHPSH